MRNAWFRVSPLFCVASILAVALQAQTGEFALVTVNDIETDAEGWMRVSAGDPYLVFSVGDPSILDMAHVNVRFESRDALSDLSYTEWFWATGSHGFSEAFKGFAILRTDAGESADDYQQIEIGRFLRRYESPDDKLSVLRMDIMPGFVGSFRIHVSGAVEKMPSKLVDMHPTYIGTHLFNGKLLKMASGRILPDFFGRLIKDPLFAVLYFGSIVACLVLVWFAWRRWKALAGISNHE
ncbi:MAG: hypothetical protein PHF70_15390 [Opitutales bacterium]|nr:hypothetical protein [Opitutales bacterium]